MSAGNGAVAAGENEETLPGASTAATDTDEATDSCLLELTAGLGEGEEAENTKRGPQGDITVPPSNPQSGISILAHKIWIGNLDKRLSQ